ncbi:ATP-binding protein [Oxynema sp. CENA135]|uniref:ATP-binding protein n=1 Tax=Oxynema sp. CENA135 TaxID=984206 RepID=UPI00190AF7CA|nr:ATP-binding protein [Oxynema sp. CENA135]MBK4731923.1 ATP-binding protein [Oxynema sp. CENA135]
MNRASIATWERANSQYTIAVAAHIHRLLEQYVARKQNLSVDLPPLDNSLYENLGREMNPPPRLETLCQKFGLSAFERQIVIACVAMGLFPSFRGLCANAHGSPQMPYPTFTLAWEVFPEPHWSAFTPQGPLRRWQLLQLGSAQVVTLCPLQIDESILHYLMGEPYQDDRLAGIVRGFDPIESEISSLQPSHRQIAERVTAVLSAPTGSGVVPVVQLCGTSPVEKWAIARAAARAMQCPLKAIAVARLPDNIQELSQLMRRWEREVVLNQSLLLVDGDRLVSGGLPQTQNLFQLIEDTQTPLILLTGDRLHGAPVSLVSFDVPKLSHQEQLAVWQQQLTQVGVELNGRLDRLVSQFNLNPAIIHTASLQLETHHPRDRLVEQLWDFCRLQARPHLDDLAQRIDCNATWDDLILPEKEKAVLADIAAHVKQRATVYETWGFAAKSARGLGISALFSGQSGTGKTMAAEVLAREFNLDLYRIDLSAVVSKYIGETEKNLRRIFDAAETGGAVLLFDEADALFGKRTDVKDSHDRHANVEVSYLLQRMEAYRGLAILTTNLKNAIDQAFLRRIRFAIPFPFPDAQARSEIWQRIFPAQTPTNELDFKKLGKLSVAGGNIRNIALNAAFLAADAGEAIAMKHILKAAQSEYVKMEKTLTDSEVRGWV